MTTNIGKIESQIVPPHLRIPTWLLPANHTNYFLRTRPSQCILSRNVAML